jgi:NAD(P)H-dependent flavin oxidoreductase YrpB (nitropropane dioxygenase family)
MEFLKKIKLIQGGMGVYVSNWRLAKAVAQGNPGVTAGTISGTGLDVVYVRLLQLGDPGGHVRRALTAFDSKFGCSIGQKIYSRYFIAEGKAPGTKFKFSPMQVVRTGFDGDSIPEISQPNVPISLNINPETIELVIATAFAEVWLAKEGHQGKVFINLMKKVELPLIFAMYGAMLAGVDAIVVGAGNPDGLAAICSDLANHNRVSFDLPVLYREAGETFQCHFDPHLVADNKFTLVPVDRPAFLAIVSQENLVKALAQSVSEIPDGFIIEHHTAGGHNAGPQGPLKTDSLGQPQYSEMDEPDLKAILDVGIPFWLAGGYGSKEKLTQALQAGAVGVQVGSTFALTEESGMKPVYRTAILNKLKTITDDSALVLTSLFSPTGFPFKVVQLEGTLSDTGVYASRTRVCDIGLLQQRGISKSAEDNTRRLFQRCSAAPIEDFIKKRGLPANANDKRCLCNGLLATVGLGQTVKTNGELLEEPAIVTLGNHLDGIRRLSRQGQTTYWVRDVLTDILGD